MEWQRQGCAKGEGGAQAGFKKNLDSSTGRTSKVYRRARQRPRVRERRLHTQALLTIHEDLDSRGRASSPH